MPQHQQSLRIERLTPEQEVRLAAWHEECLRIGTATAPADRQRAEAAITKMYDRIEKPAPRFIWCDSPLTAIMCIGILEQTHAQSLDQSLWQSLVQSLWQSLRQSLDQSLDQSLRQSLVQSLWQSLDQSLWQSLWQSLDQSLRQSLDQSLWQSLRQSLRQSWWGQQEQYWIGFYQFCAEIGVPYASDKAGDLQLWAEVAASCSWWWPYDGLVVVSDRPAELHMEPVRTGARELQLHCETGPAVRFRDGWSVYAWHGTLVPSAVIDHPDAIHATAILQERNAEVARVMLGRMGIERFCAEAGAKTLHSDIDGAGQPRRLLSIDMPNDPDRRVVAVEVKCPSTGHVYLLRVPPQMRTCVEAVAWSFGLKAKDYAPVVER